MTQPQYRGPAQVSASAVLPGSVSAGLVAVPTPRGNMRCTVTCGDQEAVLVFTGSDIVVHIPTGMSLMQDVGEHNV